SGFSELLGLIAEYGGDSDSTPVAIETDKNLFVVALAGAGFTVYPINPRALARYRERHGQSGGKSDPADAIALAHVLRTDRHLMGEPRPKLRLSSGLAEIPEISPT
ncbi:IS110 family transposase, partial [Microbacterium aerolatum]|uniref:IS110 family transposase n=1 Tax=Microbacterium aerolatum TaxID=153731 RepID=UPI002001ABDF